MKLNLKTTNEAENAAETSNCHQRGQRTVNGIIGNTKRGIVIDKTLDPDSNNPVANKPVSTALTALAGKIDAALQKPTGLTKTKLVGVGANGQENIEIGDNLTLANGKLSASGGGGGGIPVIEGTITFNEGNNEYTVSLSKAPTGNNFILYNTNYADNFLPAYLNMLIWSGNSTDGYNYIGSWYDTEIIGAILTNGTSGSAYITGAHYVFQATTAEVGSILTISEDHNPEWKLPSGSIPPLPSDASTSTYVLKAVNGTVQWVKES